MNFFNSKKYFIIKFNDLEVIAKLLTPLLTRYYARDLKKKLKTC